MTGKIENRSIHTYYRYKSISDLSAPENRFRGPIRVAVFCLVTIVLPCLLLVAPLYIRYQVFQDVTYTLGESDLVTVDKPISTLWCEGQDLWMNATFHAFLLDEQPQISEDLQHIEMDKHVQLADDSLEYWGFFLLQGSKVILSVCSRFEGARLMVVKGTKNLKHCALLDTSKKDGSVDPWEHNHAAPDGEIKFTLHHGEESHIVQTVKNKTKNTQTDSKNETDNKRRNKHKKRSSTPEPKLELAEDLENETETSANPMKDKPMAEMLNKNIRHKRNKRVIEEDHHDVVYDDYEDMPPNPVGVEQEMEQEESKLELGDDEIDEEDIRSSGSSFAKNLWSCYGGDTLFTQSFSPSHRCQSQDAMMKHAIRMRTVHEITSTGYYYYIFYSDNDIVLNDIFARFNIEKVVYSFPNYTNSCLNRTHCSLPLNFLSSEKVLLEVPLQDGVSDEDELSQMILISSCRPRLGVYFIFPVAILFLILCCAFM